MPILRHRASFERSAAFRSSSLEFGKDLFDRVQVRAAGRQEKQSRTCGAKGGADRRAFMAAKGVHDHNVTGFQRWHQPLLDLAPERRAIDRTIEHPGRVDPVLTIHGEGLRERSWFQRYERRLAPQARPARPQPRKGAMLVLAQSQPPT